MVARVGWELWRQKNHPGLLDLSPASSSSSSFFFFLATPAFWTSYNTVYPTQPGDLASSDFPPISLAGPTLSWSQREAEI